MSSVTTIGGANNPIAKFSRDPRRDEVNRREPAPWSRSPARGEALGPGASERDGLPQWMINAAQQFASASVNAFPRLHDLGVYIGQNIRSYIDGNGNLRADIAQWLQHPAVLAAAAAVAPRIIGALVINQLAFNGPPRVGPQPPL